MKKCGITLALCTIAFFGSVQPLAAADAAPASRPAGVEMASDSNTAIGLSFDRPKAWRTKGSRVVNPKSGETEITFEMEGFDAGTKATLRVSGVDVGGIAKIDVTTPANPKATASKILTIDGQPARLTAYKVPEGESEILTIQVAKGSRSYTISMVFPSSRHSAYLELAEAISRSIRIIKP